MTRMLGSGLLLLVSYQIIRQHAGKRSGQSSPNAGMAG